MEKKYIKRPGQSYPWEDALDILLVDWESLGTGRCPGDHSCSSGQSRDACPVDG